jgi:hypothetical protein
LWLFQTLGEIDPDGSSGNDATEVHSNVDRNLDCPYWRMAWYCRALQANAEK